MSYTKRWAGGFFDLPSTATPIDSAFLNAVETALLKLQAVDPTADGQVLQWDNANTRYGPALILNKNIGAGAAIDKSKLNLAGQITNADIAAGAAIDASKVNFGATIAGHGFTISTWSGGPPGSPVDGDIWVATAVDANGTRWQFQYNAGSASAYKWEFIGGAPLALNSTSAVITSTASPAQAGSGIAVARIGDYIIQVSGYVSNTIADFTNVYIGYSSTHTIAVSRVGPTTLTIPFSGVARMNDVPAASTLSAYSNVGSGTATLSAIDLTVAPVRVA